MKRARWLVTATLVLALAVIALGAYTRLTDAGLGCPDWPGCYGRLTPPVHDTHIAEVQTRFPDAQVDPFKARNEMVHRYLAGPGITAERLRTRGLGPDYPVASHGTAARRQQNRRVQVIGDNQGARR